MGAPILRPRDILAIIELIYFVPVLVSGLIVCYRHGFSKQMGWLSIVVLACFRIGASSTWIAASYHDTSNGLVVASIILQSFGVASILIAIQGLLHRLNESMPDNIRISRRVFRLVKLLTSAAIGLAMAGAIELGDSSTGNDPQGRALQRAGILIFTAILAGLFAMNANVFVHRSHIMQPERPIFRATTISLPLLFLRILFAILAVFNVDDGVFSMINQKTESVIATAFMVTLPEFIIAAVILTAGFRVPLMAQYTVQADISRPVKQEA